MKAQVIIVRLLLIMIVLRYINVRMRGKITPKQKARQQGFTFGKPITARLIRIHSCYTSITFTYKLSAASRSWFHLTQSSASSCASKVWGFVATPAGEIEICCMDWTITIHSSMVTSW